MDRHYTFRSFYAGRYCRSKSSSPHGDREQFRRYHPDGRHCVLNTLRDAGSNLPYDWENLRSYEVRDVLSEPTDLSTCRAKTLLNLSQESHRLLIANLFYFLTSTFGVAMSCLSRCDDVLSAKSKRRTTNQVGFPTRTKGV